MPNHRIIIAQTIRKHSARFATQISNNDTDETQLPQSKRIRHSEQAPLAGRQLLSNEAWLHCMQFVDELSTLYALQCTCRTLFSLVDMDSPLWQLRLRKSKSVARATSMTPEDTQGDTRRECVKRMWEGYLRDTYHCIMSSDSESPDEFPNWTFSTTQPAVLTQTMETGDCSGQLALETALSDSFQTQVWQEVFFLMYNNQSHFDQTDLCRAPLVYEALKNDPDGAELFRLDGDEGDIRVFRPQIEFNQETRQFVRQWDFRGRRVEYEGQAPQERKYVSWAIDADGKLIYSFNEDLSHGDVQVGDHEPLQAHTAEPCGKEFYRSRQIVVYPFTRTCTVLGMERQISTEDIAYVVCHVPHPQTVDDANKKPGQLIVRLRTGTYARIVANVLTTSMEKECGFVITSESLLSLFGMDCSHLFA